jgi:outer membrane protein OmpA-like peptidoglycan-associated protein
MSRWAIALVIVLMVGACATPRPSENDQRIQNLRAELDRLLQDTAITERVPLAVADAERAVRSATSEGINGDERYHRTVMAEKRIEIARAEAYRVEAEQQIEVIDENTTRLQLNASRLEIQRARAEAEQARLASIATQEEIQRTRQQALTAEELRAQATERERMAREEAEAARRLTEAQATEIALARREAELASEAAASLRRRLELMELRETDRGMVITLGDVLFAVGETALAAQAQSNLADVVELLQSEPDKRVRIEGHTDSTGAEAVNLRISQQRADAVRDQLIALGVNADRIEAVGMGQDFPIASNDSAQGRSQNRRVDVILLDDQ